MTSLRDGHNDTSRRNYKRQKMTITSDFIATETEEMSMELIHNHNSSAIELQSQPDNNNNQQPLSVAVFIDDSGDDDNDNDDSDIDIDESALLRNNEMKCNRLDARLFAIFFIRRITDCIVMLPKIFAWYCESCRAGGVLRCGIVTSKRMTTRAQKEHIESLIHYKHSPEPIKRLLDDYKNRMKSLCRLYINYTLFV